MKQIEISGRLLSFGANDLSSSSLSKNINIRIHRNVILPFVLYGCETWPLTLWEEYRLEVFNNRMLGKVFGPNRDEVTGEWRRLLIAEQILLSFER